MPRTSSARTSLPAPPEYIAAGITVLVDIVYVLIRRSQDEGFTSRAVFIAVHMLVLAAILVLARRVDNPFARAALLAAGANSLILVGFLGLFTIGLPLLIAGLILMPTLGRVLAEMPQPTGPAIVGLATLIGAGVMIAGLLATQ